LDGKTSGKTVNSGKGEKEYKIRNMKSFLCLTRREIAESFALFANPQRIRNGCHQRDQVKQE
jgi:hypothetical protein